MHPESTEQLNALKAFAKAMKVKFETNKSPYNTDFVKKIQESKRQVEKGNFTTATFRLTAGIAAIVAIQADIQRACEPIRREMARLVLLRER